MWFSARHIFIFQNSSFTYHEPTFDFHGSTFHCQNWVVDLQKQVYDINMASCAATDTKEPDNCKQKIKKRNGNQNS